MVLYLPYKLKIVTTERKNSISPSVLYLPYKLKIVTTKEEEEYEYESCIYLTN